MSGLYDNLKRTVEDLAAPADKQEAMLRKARVGPDELALDFDTFAAAALNLAESGELSQDALEAVRALNAHLEAFGGAHNAKEWTEAALYCSTNWATARTLAADILRLMA